MGKTLLYIVVVIFTVVGFVFVANSQSKTKSMQDIMSSLPPTPIFVSQTPTPLPQQETLQQHPQLTIIPRSESPTPPSAEAFIQEMASKTATIKTSKGDITLSFYPQEAPNTVYNFVKKATIGFFNNLTFHRVEDWVVQGGDPKGDGTGGNSTMQVEFNNQPFIIGSLGAASKSDGKTQNDAQFFITKKESSWLNGQYTNFGMVKSGIEVVNSLEIGDKILGIIIE